MYYVVHLNLFTFATAIGKYTYTYTDPSPQTPQGGLTGSNLLRNFENFRFLNYTEQNSYVHCT